MAGKSQNMRRDIIFQLIRGNALLILSNNLVSMPLSPCKALVGRLPCLKRCRQPVRLAQVGGVAVQQDLVEKAYRKLFSPRRPLTMPWVWAVGTFSTISTSHLGYGLPFSQ